MNLSVSFNGETHGSAAVGSLHVFNKLKEIVNIFLIRDVLFQQLATHLPLIRMLNFMTRHAQSADNCITNAHFKIFLKISFIL